MLRRFLAVPAVLLALLAMGPSEARAQTYLTLESDLEGGVVPGDVTTPVRDAIEVLSFAQESVVPIDPRTGQPTGTTRLFPLVFRKPADVASIPLLRILDRIESLARFELQVFEPSGGTATPVLRVELRGAVLVSVATAMRETEGVTETWTVAFERIIWEDLVNGTVYEDGMETTSVEGGPLDPLARVSSFPNPTSGPTEFRFRVPTAGPATIDVFDVRGRRVARVYDGMPLRNDTVVTWDGLDDAGRPVATGTYLVKMRAGRWLTSQKLAVVR